MEPSNRQRLGVMLSSLAVGIGTVNVFDIGRTFTVSILIAIALGGALFGLSELIRSLIARR